MNQETKTIKQIKELPYPKYLINGRKNKHKYYICPTCFELIIKYIINRLKNE